MRLTVCIGVSVTAIALSVAGSSSATEPVSAAFSLDSLTAAPGTIVKVPFRLFADRDVAIVGCSIDFDEDVLQVTEIEPVFQRPDGMPWSVWIHNVNNENSTPGNAGVDEGWIQAAIVFSYDTLPVAIPADRETEVFTIHFKVKDTAAAGVTEVRFQEGANGIVGTNIVVPLDDVLAWSEPPSEPASLLLGSVLKLVAGGIFERGDATGDGTTNISDPLAVLDYLFTGERGMPCADAADANDDGQLNMSDPISILSFLFLGEREIPAPHPECGADPSEDTLGCEAYGGC